MMNRVRRTFCLAAVATLPFTAGAGVAGAQSAPAGQDRFYVDTDTDLTDADQLLVDARVGSTDHDGDATGVRSRTTSSDIADVEDVRSDTRTATNDEGHDSTSSRAILGIDDVSTDGINSDIDLVRIDENNEEGTDGMGGQLAGQPSGNAGEQQYSDDAEYVFGE